MAQANGSSARRHAPPAVGWGLGVIGIIVLVRLWPELGVPCLFRRLLELPCPTCGGTRAIRALAHLDLGEAFALNPLVTGLALALLAKLALAPLTRGRGRPRPRRGTRPSTALVGLFGAVLLNWSYLLIAGRV